MGSAGLRTHVLVENLCLHDPLFGCCKTFFSEILAVVVFWKLSALIPKKKSYSKF